MLLSTPAGLDRLKLGERILLPVQAVEAVRALELQLGWRGRVLDQVERSRVVVRVEVEEEEGLEGRGRGRVEGED